MKYFLCTLFCLSTFFCQAHNHHNEKKYQHEVVREYINYNLSRLDKHLQDLEDECAEVKMTFEYHVGYIMGQRKAYLDILDMIPKD